MSVAGSNNELKTLGELVEFISGFAFKSNAFNSSGEGLPIVRIRDVVRGQSETYYQGKYDDTYLVNDGDYLIGMDGEFNLAKWKGGTALLNQRVCKIGSVSDLLDRDYLARFLPKALKIIEDATPFVTVKHLSVKSLREIQIPLPPLAEQKRIAAILDAADELRTKRRESLAQIDTLLQSTFLDLFGDPVTNPKGWAKMAVGEFAKVKGGKRLPKGEDYADAPTGYRYIRVSDISPNRIDESDLRNLKPETQKKIARYIVESGDVIITIAGTIGLTAAVPDSLDGVNLTENAAKIVPEDKRRVNALYLSYALQMPHAQSQIRSHTGQVTIGKLALFRIEKIEVLLPPEDQQMRFADFVSETEAQRMRMSDQLDELDTLFASLQSRAFRGEL